MRKLISQATTAQAAIDDLLQQARRYRAAGQLIKPAGENAAELYHRVLATDPDNVFAAQGLNEVTAQITATADQLLAAVKNSLTVAAGCPKTVTACRDSFDNIFGFRGWPHVPGNDRIFQVTG